MIEDRRAVHIERANALRKLIKFNIDDIVMGRVAVQSEKNTTGEQTSILK